MTKFQPNRTTLRSKSDVLKDFSEYLLREGMSTEEELKNLTDEQLDGLLHELLYETEEINGVATSSPRAWYLWINIVLKHNPVTLQPLWNKFVQEAYVDIEQHRLVCLLASRGLGKSYLVYVLYSLFKMYLFEGTKILIASNVPDMCKRNIREAKKMIDSNEMLIEKKGLYKKRELIWSQEKFEFNDGIIETATAGANVRGFHPNYIFIDDILRDDFKYSDEEIINFMFGQIYPMSRTFKCRIVITGTPLHTRDVYHDIMNTEPNFAGIRLGSGAYSHKGFWCRDYKIIKDWDTKEMYHTHQPASWWELADVRNPQSAINVQGQSKFMREFMLVCTDESTTMFPEKLLNGCTQNYEYLEMAEQITNGRDPAKTYIMGVDVATAGEASSDSSAFLVIEILNNDVGMKKIVRHITCVKGMPVPDQNDKIQELSKRFNNCFVVIEKNNVGVALIQELQRRNVPVDEYTTSKTTKEMMMRYLVSEMKNGNLYFPKETPETRSLKKELLNFGVKKTKQGKEKMEALSGHDDQVIALAIANYAASYMTSVPFIATANLYQR